MSGWRPVAVLVCAAALGLCGACRRERAVPPHQAATGIIAAAVTDGDGQPVGGALIGINGSSNFGLTANDGSYRFEDVPAGVFTVTAQMEGLGNASVTVTVQPGETTTVSLALGE